MKKFLKINHIFVLVKKLFQREKLHKNSNNSSITGNLIFRLESLIQILIIIFLSLSLIQESPKTTFIWA